MFDRRNNSKSCGCDDRTAFVTRISTYSKLRLYAACDVFLRVSGAGELMARSNWTSADEIVMAKVEKLTCSQLRALMDSAEISYLRSNHDVLCV